MKNYDEYNEYLNNKIIKYENKSNNKIEKKKQKYNNKLLKLKSYEENIDPIKLEKKRKNKELNEAPKLSILEEIGNSVTHGVGAIFGVLCLVLMLVKSDTPAKYVSSSVYGACLILMFLMSCLYHSFKHGLRVKRIWRRFDYSSIYLQIGGTFAPLYLVLMANYPIFGLENGRIFGLVLFIIQWVIIITGITFVCVFGPGRLRWLHYPLYFLLGWSGLMLVPTMIKYEIMLFWFILIGGLVYTIGMIPFVLKGKKSAHFIWHFFVLVGAIVQWIGIFLYVI